MGCDHRECGVLVSIKDGRVVRIKGDPDHPESRGEICPRGANYAGILYHPSRTKYPLKRVGEGWQRVSWDEALNTISDNLLGIKETYGPQAIAGATRSRPSLISLYLFTHSLGSPNVLGSIEPCEGAACIADCVTVGELITQWYGTHDTENSNYILVWGSNPIISYPLHRPKLLRAKARGARFVVIDPRHTETAKEADTWLQIRPGTDAALALSMLNVIINDKLYDEEFVSAWCVGFEKLKERVQEYPPEKVEKITWIPAKYIKKVARDFASTKPACIITRQGVMQQSNSVQTARAQVILVAITGNIDVPGGHLLDKKPGRLKLKKDLLLSIPESRLTRALGANEYPLLTKFCKVANMASAIEAMLKGDIKALVVAYHNPIITYPDTRKVYEALKRLELLVVVDFFKTPTAELAHFILPATTWLERDGIAGDLSQKCISIRQKAIEPIGEAWDDHKIFFEFAKRMKLDGFVKWKSVKDFNEYQLSTIGLTFEQFKRIGYWRFPVKYKEYITNGFKTPSRKVELYSGILEKYGYDPLPHYREPVESEVSTPELNKNFPLVLITGVRQMPYMHSQGKQLSWARRVIPDPIVEINPKSAMERGIEEGDWVWIVTPRGKIRMKAKVTEDVHPKVVSAPHGWWFPERPDPEHGCFESNVNVITTREPPYADPIAGTGCVRGLLAEVYK